MTLFVIHKDPFINIDMYSGYTPGYLIITYMYTIEIHALYSRQGIKFGDLAVAK